MLELFSCLFRLVLLREPSNVRFFAVVQLLENNVFNGSLDVHSWNSFKTLFCEFAVCKWASNSLLLLGECITCITSHREQPKSRAAQMHNAIQRACSIKAIDFFRILKKGRSLLRSFFLFGSRLGVLLDLRFINGVRLSFSFKQQLSWMARPNLTLMKSTGSAIG